MINKSLLLILGFLLITHSAAKELGRKKRTQVSTKFITVYTEGGTQGVELAVCNEHNSTVLAKRRKLFEKFGEDWGHLTFGNKELRMYLLSDSMATSDYKAKHNFIGALRSISNENRKRGTQFFSKDHGKLTFEISGWESKKPTNFVYETDGKLYRGEGKSRGILKQGNIGEKPYIKPHQVLSIN